MNEQGFAQWAGKTLTPEQFQTLVETATKVIISRGRWPNIPGTSADVDQRRLSAVALVLLDVHDAGQYRAPRTWPGFVGDVRRRADEAVGDRDRDETLRPRREPVPIRPRGARFCCPGEVTVGRHRVPCPAGLPFRTRGNRRRGWGVRCRTCGLGIHQGTDVELDPKTMRRVAESAVYDLQTPRLSRPLRRLRPVIEPLRDEAWDGVPDRDHDKAELGSLEDLLYAARHSALSPRDWARREMDRLRPELRRFERKARALAKRWRRADARARAVDPRGPILVERIESKAEKEAWESQMQKLRWRKRRGERVWWPTKPAWPVFRSDAWDEAESLREQGLDAEGALEDLRAEVKWLRGYVEGVS